MVYDLLIFIVKMLNFKQLTVIFYRYRVKILYLETI